MFDSELESTIHKELIKKGWPEKDILVEVYLNQDGRRLRPDMILLYNLYPLAIVEVKSQLKHLDDATRQGLLYAEALPEIPFVIATNGKKSKITKTIDGQISEFQGLPSPKDLWASLNREWDDRDPRILPPLKNNKYPVRLHQARAISISLDRIIKGEKRNLVAMVAGSGRTLTIIQLLWKLIYSDYFSKALLLTDRWELANQIQSVLQDTFQQDAQIFNQQSELKNSRKLDVSVIHTFFEQSGDLKSLEISKDFYDLIFVDDIKRVDLFKPLLAYFEEATVVGFTSSPNAKNLDEILGTPIFTYGLEDALSSERFAPPPGFSSKLLGDIADISAGLMQYKKDKREEIEFTPYPEKILYLLSAREIDENGNIDLLSARRQNPDSVQLSKTVKRHGLQLNDIVVNSYFLGRSKIKIGLVSGLVKENIIITRSLIRVRVNPKHAKPEDVYDFLLSDAGQKALSMYAQGSTSPRLTVRYLSQVPIFLPIDEDENLYEKEDLTASARAIDELEHKVLPLLKEFTKQSKNEGSEKLLEVQQRLIDISSSLLPPPLSERITNEYPLPIAYTYQQYKNAKFNIYEQVQRLKDTFEAVNFFVYNLLLADHLHNLDQSKYYIEDSQARRAYKGYSMAYRIGFIEAVQKIAEPNKGQDLFAPEIIGFDTEKARKLQDDLRNEAAHTATAPEHAQREVIKKFQPLVDDMLADLEFLTNYRLVRIPLFYFKKNQLFRRTELYQGVAPIVEEIPTEETGLMQADRDHLVLVNTEEQILDLYPFYQLIASERSNYQRHIAFFKQRKFQERRLEGESVQGAYGVDLEGFDDFENLVAKIIDARPEEDE